MLVKSSRSVVNSKSSVSRNVAFMPASFILKSSLVSVARLNGKNCTSSILPVSPAAFMALVCAIINACAISLSLIPFCVSSDTMFTHLTAERGNLRTLALKLKLNFVATPNSLNVYVANL